jgi:membrane associated rhomboid family serine protease
MDSSTLYPLLSFAVFLVSQSVHNKAFVKLTQEQQQAAGSVQSVLLWLMIPLFVIVGMVIWFADDIESVAWIRAVYGLSWGVPMLIIFTWENRRLRAKNLPASYLKERLFSQSVLVVGCLLILLWP